MATLDRRFRAPQFDASIKKDRQRAAAAGFDSHLTKPVDAAALESLLDESKAHSTMEDLLRRGEQAI